MRIPMKKTRKTTNQYWEVKKPSVEKISNDLYLDQIKCFFWTPTVLWISLPKNSPVTRLVIFLNVSCIVGSLSISKWITSGHLSSLWHWSSTWIKCKKMRSKASLWLVLSGTSVVTSTHKLWMSNLDGLRVLLFPVLGTLAGPGNPFSLRCGSYCSMGSNRKSKGFLSPQQLYLLSWTKGFHITVSFCFRL